MHRAPRPLDPATVGAAVLVIAVVSGMIVWAIHFAGSDIARDGMSSDARRNALVQSDAIPYGERDSIKGCGKRGYGISACLESEAALRPKAQTLWASRSAEVRRECMRSVGIYEPVGVLYTCLAAAGEPPAQGRP